MRITGLVTLLLATLTGISVLAADRPNILLIVADDLGYGELGCYGGKDVPTPNLDALAADGARCTSGYVSCPVCSPTRAGLMTGRYQQRFGHEFNPGGPAQASPVFGLPRSERCLPELLKDAGYATGMVGKWHLGFREKHRPTERGFQEFFGFLGGAHAYQARRAGAMGPLMRGLEEVEEPAYLTDAFAREASDYIARHSKEPFFLYLAFNAVHAPMQAAAKYRMRFENVQDERRRTFCAMLSALDDAVGVVLSKLKEERLEENTLVVFLSDNGGPTPQTTSRNTPLGGVKSQVYEGGIRVPFLLRWPGRIPAGAVYEHPVIALDILPTVLAASGTKADGLKLDGRDLVPFLSGKERAAPHEALFWRFGEQLAARKGDWKLVKTRNGQTKLFDLKADIGETKDVSAEHPKEFEELKALLEKWNSGLATPLWGPRGQAASNR